MFEDGKSLNCVKRLLWNQVDAMIADINKDELDLSARQALVKSGKVFDKRKQRKSNQKPGRTTNINNNYNKSTAKFEIKMYGHCFRAQKP